MQPMAGYMALARERFRGFLAGTKRLTSMLSNQACNFAKIDNGSSGFEGKISRAGVFDMLTLYYAPGACSIAAHIVLEESGEKYVAKKIDLGWRRAAYRGLSQN
jgi:hypothetical protein